MESVLVKALTLVTVLYGLGRVEKTGCRRPYFSPNPNRSSTDVLLSQLGTGGIRSPNRFGQFVPFGAVLFTLKNGHCV